MRYIPWQIERLDELVTLWNKELKESLPMRTELFQQNSFLDKNISYEGSRIVINDDDKVIGFIVVKLLKEETEVKMRNDVAWIQALLVDSAYRNKGIGTELLKHAEAIIKQREANLICLGRDLYHYLPGIPKEEQQTRAWFEKRGYEHDQSNVDLTRYYHPSEEIYWPSKPEAEFTILLESEKEKLLDFLHRCFPGRWEHEAIQYFEKGGTGREFVVLKEKGEIIGFCRINDANSPIIMGNMNWSALFDANVGGVGPLGVDAEKRKKGYGLAIVQAGIAFLRDRGVNQVVIDWTGLIEFYQKLGYEVWKRYEGYRKEI
ncbi:GNAT family N-acetyltransferase [Ornithinibacillus halotolerans]|uniref:Acetyltransferase n=1 Tax=Ornithinibacillus halotolerans TaxID=1274357 RepID=A0A916RS20_9BACI|nr:GNAT family N-acetyltransferase [Ornithinibacillus halotolerans]GGA66734.1 acetyltransferase [Ornithinibacillus halotolerans]